MKSSSCYVINEETWDKMDVVELEIAGNAKYNEKQITSICD